MYSSKEKGCDKHYHLICEKCNNLYHFESNQMPKISAEAKNNEDFEIDNSRIAFYGICKKCKKGDKNEN